MESNSLSIGALLSLNNVESDGLVKQPIKARWPLIISALTAFFALSLSLSLSVIASVFFFLFKTAVGQSQDAIDRSPQSVGYRHY